MSRHLPWLIGLALASAPTVATAAGYYIGDPGARGTARGGAFVANPDSVLAIHYNPAGLSLLNGLHVYGNLNLVKFSYDFDRKCPCLDPGITGAADQDARLESQFETASNQNGAQDVPFIGVAYGLPFYDITIGLGFWGPQGVRRFRFQEQNVQLPGDTNLTNISPARYSLRSLELVEAYYALSVAAQPIKGLRIGFAGHLYDFGTKLGINLWANTTAASLAEDPALDIPVQLDFKRGAALNWSAGVSYDLPFGLTIGGSVLGKRSVRADGTAALVLTDTLQAAGIDVQGDQIEAELNLPPVWRVGLEWARHRVARVEAAAVIEAWGIYDAVLIRPKNIDVSVGGQSMPLGTIPVEYNLETTVAIKVGGELTMFEPWLGIRAGYFYEPSAVPTRFKDASTPDLAKNAFSIGLATTWYGVTFEIAAQFVALTTLDIDDSERRLIGPLEDGPQGLLTTTANGRYSGNHIIGGASLSFSLDELLSDDTKQ